MKYLTLLTLFVCNHIFAANNKIINQLNKSQNQWFAYSVPAQAGTVSTCCWNKFRNSEYSNFQSCDLTKEVYGFGSTDKSPLSKNINIYVHVKNNKLKQILPVGDSCKVKTDKLEWLSDITQETSINWLNELTTNKPNKIKDDAMHAISLHESNSASASLFNIAKQDKKLSEKAIFWLGESRNDGVKHLKQLYELLPTGDAKKHINFALAQSKDEQGLTFLKHIAKTDNNHKQKADAVFWLAQVNAEGVVPLISDIISQNESGHLVEHSVFSLSQIETKESADALYDLAKNHKQSAVRQKALFWLAEVNPKQAKTIAMKIIEDAGNRSEIDNAIFTLTQLSEDYGDDGLFELLTGNYDKHIKKQALFWLSQSDDSYTIDKLQQML